MYNCIYYIDTNVLLENMPLVKFIKNYIRDTSGLFSIISHVSLSMITGAPPQACTGLKMQTFFFNVTLLGTYR